MTEKGQYPLVYQLENRNGTLIPVGLAEASSLGSFSAVNIVVSSISATDYLGFESNVSFTGVLSVQSTGTGTGIVILTDPNNPVIRTLVTPTNSFLEPGLAGDGSVQIGYGANPLSHDHGGTNNAEPPVPDGVAHWFNDGDSVYLDTASDFTFNKTNLSIPAIGKYQIDGNNLNLTHLDGITSPTTLNNIPAPTTNDTYLVYKGGSITWSAVTGTGTGSTSFPSDPGRIPITNSTTQLVTYSELSYASATKILTTYSINNVCDVCAIRFNEGGTLLSDKYQGKDAFLTTLSTQGKVNLASNQVCGSLPITNGGTGASSAAAARSNLSLVPGTNIQEYSENLTSLANLTITDKSILVGNSGGDLENIIAPTTNNTFLKYSGGLFIWTGVAETNSFPNQPGRIPYIINSTTLGSESWLNIETGTGRFNVCEVYAQGTIYEGGTSLVNKYQVCDIVLQSIASLNPGANELIYFTGTNTATTTTLTPNARNLLDDTTFAAMRTTLELGNLATRSITSPPPGGLYFEADPTGTFNTDAGLIYDKSTFVLKSPTVSSTTVCATTMLEGGQSLASKYLTQSNATTTYLAKTNFNTWSGSLALSAGLLDVQIAGPTGGQALKWDNSLKKWTNQADDTGLAGGTPGGGNKNVQINYDPGIDSPVFSGNDGLTYDLATSTLRAQYYSNLPSASPYWNANQLSGYPLVSGITQPGPKNGDILIFLSGIPGFTNGWYYDAPAAATAGGSPTQIQFNNGGAFSGSPSLVWTNSTNTLSSTNFRSTALSSLSVSTNAFFPFSTPRRNFIYYGSPTLVAQGQMTVASSLWFSANALITGDANPSATLFTQRIALAGIRSGTTGAAGTSLVLGRYIANPAVGPSVDPTTEDPPTFVAATGTVYGLAYIDPCGALGETDNASLFTVNNFNDSILLNTLSATTDVFSETITCTNLFVDDIKSSTVSATTYLNLPSSTLVWSAALSATNAFRSTETLTVVKYVKNTTGQTIPKGTPVTITGATGDNALITPLSSVNNHIPEAIGLSNHVFGLAQSQILNDAFGYIITEGVLSGTGGAGNGLNTAAFTEGDILYVSSNGQLSNVRPQPPYEPHPVGYVLRAQNPNGSIYVKIETVPEINDIVGMNLASSLVNGDLISYESSSNTFKNVQTINISGQGKFGSVSATTYLNLPNVSALAGTGVFEVTSYSRSNYVLTSVNTNLSSLVTNLQASTASISSTVSNHLASAVHWDLTTLNNNYINASGDSVTGAFFFGGLSATNFSATNYLNLPSVTGLNGTGVFEVTSYSRSNFVLTSTNLELSNTVTGHLASAVHWDLTTLNNNYINASGDSVTGAFFFGTLSATTLSATTYRNLPTSALSGLSDVLITSPALSSVLKWNGSKWVPATDQTGGGGGSPPGGTVPGAIQFLNGTSDGFDAADAFYYASKSLYIDHETGGQLFTDDITVTNGVTSDSINSTTVSVNTTLNVGNTVLTQQGIGNLRVASGLITSSVSSLSISATTYLNLPSGVATWNANKLQGVSISTATPTTNHTLVYNGTTWAPSPADGLTKSLITQSFGGF